ncbi:hypothetical protein, partial [Pseudomonas aeruginosa]
MTVSYTQGLEISVLGAVDRARSAIKDYRTHSDVARLLVETAREIAMPLKMSAYLLGHLDGLDEEVDIDSRCHFAGELTPHFHELLGALCSGQPIPDSGLSFSSATAGGNPSLN